MSGPRGELQALLSRIDEYEEDSRDESECSSHPDAPHGFDRNGSHNADRYVCDCEGWGPDARENAQLAKEALDWCKSHRGILLSVLP